MSIRDDLLPVLQDVRTLVADDDLGFRRYRVWLVREHWDADVFDGTLPVGAEEISPSPMYEPNGAGVIVLSKITPSFGTGGLSVADLSPSIDGTLRLYFLCQRRADPTEQPGPIEPYRLTGFVNHKNSQFILTIERHPWPLLKGNRRIARAAGTYGR
jgi:hypothetical protein